MMGLHLNEVIAMRQDNKIKKPDLSYLKAFFFSIKNPKTISRAAVFNCALLGCTLTLFPALARSCGIWVNLSSSIPPGIYHQAEGAILRGDCVLSCVPSSAAALAYERHYIGYGNCPMSTAPVGKYAVGLPGDQARINQEGIVINGTKLNSTKPLELDIEKRTLEPFMLDRQLSEDEYLLAGKTKESYDSRYFGPVSKKEIKGKIEAVYLF